MSPPADKVNRSPKSNEDREQSSKWVLCQVPNVLVRQEEEEGKESGPQQPSLQVVHPLKVDSNLITVVIPY